MMLAQCLQLLDLQMLLKLTLKRLGGQFDPLWLFQKFIFQSEGESLVFSDFQYYHKAQQGFLNQLTSFIDFLDF